MEETKSAYVVANITILDQNKWAEYRSKVGTTLTPWGAELIFRGKKVEVLSGENVHTDTVVIRFPSLKALNNWMKSDAYQALIPIREQGAKMDLTTYQSQS